MTEEALTSAITRLASVFGRYGYRRKMKHREGAWTLLAAVISP
jgi:hypothetical protein